MWRFSFEENSAIQFDSEMIKPRIKAIAAITFTNVLFQFCY